LRPAPVARGCDERSVGAEAGIDYRSPDAVLGNSRRAPHAVNRAVGRHR
jgi:hypothetical protein